MPKSDLLTVTQAAPLVGLSRETLQYHCRKKNLRTEQLADGTYLIRRSDLDKFAKTPRPTGPKPAKK